MKKIRYGVIGIKGFGYYHCHFVQQYERAELAALVDIDEGFVKKRSEELGVRGFTNHRDMIEAGIVDAVSIVTPHHTHAPIALDCLKAGLHVFVEKPMATRVSEAVEMIEAAKAKKLKLCVGYLRRVYSTAKALKHLIDSGEIGRVLRILWTYGEFRAEDYYHRDDMWRATWRQAGGGVLTNQVSHDLDLICWLIGKPVKVSALVGNQLHKAEIEDIAGVSVVFENGAFGSLQFTVNQPRGYSVRQIAGDKGILVMSDVRSTTLDKDDQILIGTYQAPLNFLLTDFKGHMDQPQISWRPVDFGDGLSATKRTLKTEGADSDLKEPKSPKGPGPDGPNFWRIGGPRRVLRKLRSVIKKQRPKTTPGFRTRPDPFAVLINSFIDAIIDGGEPIVTPESALITLELLNAITLSAIRNKTVTLPIDHGEYDRLYAELADGDAMVPRFR